MEDSCPKIFSKEDWHRMNYKWFCESNVARCDWHKLREQATSNTKELDDLMQHCQDQSKKNLERNAQELNATRNQISNYLDNLTIENQKLIAQKQRLVSSFNAVQIALNICIECQNLRRQRIACDIVEDDLQCALFIEENTLREYQCKLQQILQEVNNQITRNMDAKLILENEWSSKNEAYQIDHNLSHLNNNSTDNIAFYPVNQTSLKQIKKCDKHDDIEKEIEATINLYNYVDEFLKELANKLKDKSECVNVCLSRQVIETSDCLYRLVQHLDLIAKDIAQAEETVTFLRQEVLERDACMKVAQTRIHFRTQRNDACMDAPQESLNKEIEEITLGVHKLKQNLEIAESGLANLLKVRRNLENEASIKQNTLIIDKERCTIVRKRYPLPHKFIGY